MGPVAIATFTTIVNPALEVPPLVVLPYDTMIYYSKNLSTFTIVKRSDTT